MDGPPDMLTTSTLRFALILLLGLPLAPALATAQSVQVRSTQLELGLTGALPLASSRYERGVDVGGGLVARFALARGPFVFDTALEAGVLRVHEAWYDGVFTSVRDSIIIRVRAMLGVRYALVAAERVQLYARLGVGLESRIGRYDERHLDEPDEPRQRDLSWAPVIEPCIGLRLGGAHRFVLLQLAAPIAPHQQEPIRVSVGHEGTLAVDLTASLLVGWTL